MSALVSSIALALAYTLRGVPCDTVLASIPTDSLVQSFGSATDIDERAEAIAECMHSRQMGRLASDAGALVFFERKRQLLVALHEQLFELSAIQRGGGGTDHLRIRDMPALERDYERCIEECTTIGAGDEKPSTALSPSWLRSAILLRVQVPSRWDLLSLGYPEADTAQTRVRWNIHAGRIRLLLDELPLGTLTPDSAFSERYTVAVLSAVQGLIGRVLGPGGKMRERVERMLRTHAKRP